MLRRGEPPSHFEPIFVQTVQIPSLRVNLAPFSANSFDLPSMPFFSASSSAMPCSAAYLRTPSVIFIEHPALPSLRRTRKFEPWFVGKDDGEMFSPAG